jgi:hypothetical protein
MHTDLTRAFNRLVDLLEADPRCLGGWHFGSVGRGTADEYSDYDPVFLITGEGFESFAEDIPKRMNDISDELLICWPESFNNGYFKNFCCAIRIGENIHQLDVFMANRDHFQDWMCKLHLAGCTKEHLIFDKNGETAALLDKGYGVENHKPDILRAIETYGFHIIMLIKYFKRGDVFKVIKNIGVLFHAHVDVLLSRYDTLSWGGWESKVKHCVPEDKQTHLTTYFTPAKLPLLKNAVKNGLELFIADAAEICKYNGVKYPEDMVRQVKTYFYLHCLQEAQDAGKTV